MFSFDQINDALLHCSSYHLTEEPCHEHHCTLYALRDGTGEIDGCLFETLEDVADFVCNNADVEAYLVMQNTVKRIFGE